MKNWSISEYIFTIEKRKSFSAPKNFTNILIYSDTFIILQTNDGNFKYSSKLCGCYGDRQSLFNILLKSILYSIYNISSLFLCLM